METIQNRPGTFCWFECGTTDAASAKRFYTGLFGWSAVDVPMPEDMGVYTLFRIDERDVAGLYELKGPQFENVPPHWMTYVRVEDVDESAAKAESLGGKIEAPPIDVPGVGRIAVIADPTGAHISLFKPGEHPGAPASSQPGHFGWSELATNDTAAAQEFYGRLFGWGAKVDDNTAIPYTEFQLEGVSLAGMMALTAQQGDAPPHWLPYVVVADCDAVAAKAAELGGTQIVPPTHIPDVGPFSVFADPAGAVLAVVQLKQ